MIIQKNTGNYKIYNFSAEKNSEYYINDTNYPNFMIKLSENVDYQMLTLI